MAFLFTHCGQSRGKSKKTSRGTVGFHKAIESYRFTQGILQGECLQSRFLSMFRHDKGFKADGYNMSIIKPFPDNSKAIPCPLRIGRTVALSTFIAFIYTYVSYSIPWFH